jgi:hypothetical protein
MEQIVANLLYTTMSAYIEAQNLSRAFYKELSKLLNLKKETLSHSVLNQLKKKLYDLTIIKM